MKYVTAMCVGGDSKLAAVDAMSPVAVQPAAAAAAAAAVAAAAAGQQHRAMSRQQRKQQARQLLAANSSNNSRISIQQPCIQLLQLPLLATATTTPVLAFCLSAHTMHP